MLALPHFHKSFPHLHNDIPVVFRSNIPVTHGVPGIGLPVRATTKDNDNIMKLKTTLLTAATLLAIPAAQGAIVWTGGAVTGNSDVSTNGSLEYAYDLGGSGVTVNNVAFAAGGTGGTVGSITFHNPDGGGNHNFNNIDPATNIIGTLLDSARWTTSGTTETVTLGGLTVGQEYEVQVFSSDTRSASGRTLVVDGTDYGLIDGSLVDSNDPNSVRHGVFVTGTFTATATTEDFTYTYGGSGGGNPQLNAIQVRLVPEPSAVLLGGLAALGLLARRRK